MTEEQPEPFMTTEENGVVTVDNGPIAAPDPFDGAFKKEADKDAKLKEVLEIFALVKAWREQEVDPLWQRAWDIYNGTPASSNPYSAFYVQREVFKLLSVANAMDAKLLAADGFTYESEVEGGDDDATSATAVVKKQLRELGLDSEINTWRDERRTWGVSYLLVGWSKYRRLQSQVYTKSTNPSLTKREINPVEHEGPYLKWICPTAIYTMPDYDNLRDSPYVFMVERVSGATLRMDVIEGRLDKDTVLQYLKERGQENTASETVSEPDQPDFGLDSWLNPLHEFELMTVWTNDGYEYSIIDQKALVKANKTIWGFAPILTLRANTRGGQHYGVPDPIIVEADALYYSDLLSMLVDSIHYTTTPMFSVNRNLRNEWDLVAFKPGATVYRNDPDDIKFMSPAPTIPGNLLQFAEQARASMGNSLGISDTVAGQSGHSTASGTQLLQQAGSVRLGYAAQLMAPEFRTLFWMLYDLNARNLERIYPMKIPGKVGQEVFKLIGPKSFSGMITVKINLALDSESDQEKRAKWSQLWQLVRDDSRFNHQRVQLGLAKSFGEDNPKAMIADPTTNQLDAVKALMAWRETGVMPNAVPHDNHEIFSFLIQQEMSGPFFMQANEAAQNNLQDSLQWHQGYLKQQVEAAGKGVQTAPGAGAGQGGSYDQSGNKMGAGMGSGMAEGMQGNGMTGAQQNAPL